MGQYFNMTAVNSETFITGGLALRGGGGTANMGAWTLIGVSAPLLQEGASDFTEWSLPAVKWPEFLLSFVTEII